MKRFLIILDKIINGMTFLAGLILIFVMLTVCMDVVLRTFFRMPQMWVTEVIECLLLYITFLATAWLLREEGHVQVDIILNRMKPRTIALFGVISSLIGVFVSSVLTWFGATVTWDYFQRGIYTPSVMEIPVYLILMIIPIGSLFLTAQFIRRTLKNIAGFIIETTESGSES
ncbi:MAG: TRAP transporter small permease [Desulfobacteraceae bacterium]|jgi:TRAP-type C4-dicarboxylate transport system permease small subunit